MSTAVTLRCLTLALLALALLPRWSGAEAMRLPAFFAADDLLETTLDRPAPMAELRIVGTGAGLTNVGSLWTLAEDHQPPRSFAELYANADLQTGSSIGYRMAGWWIGYGQGRREWYTGNHDAAQLWLDLHATDGYSQARYEPSANSSLLKLSWVGVGRRVPLHAGRLRGHGDLYVRRLIADDLLQRALVGEVEEDSFSGVVKTRTAGWEAEVEEGAGWSVDGRVQLAFGERWQALLTAEGLLGQLSWDGLTVDNGLVTSHGVYTDPDGFLHHYSGVTGMTWKEKLTADLATAYRLEVMYRADVAFLVGGSYHLGQVAPMAGVAWPRGGRWTPYVRAHVNDARLEVGAVGNGWRVSIIGDDWLLGDPRRAGVTVAITGVQY